MRSHLFSGGAVVELCQVRVVLFVRVVWPGLARRGGGVAGAWRARPARDRVSRRDFDNVIPTPAYTF